MSATTSSGTEHATNGGYVAGCRDTCCRTAHAAYRRSVWRKRYARGVDRLYVDATGTHRRIRALQALGWRLTDIDQAMGHAVAAPNSTRSHNYVKQAKVHVDNARAVTEVYERLCMTLGPSDRLRAMAVRQGWVPPLAWDDIDDVTERPKVPRTRDWTRSHDLDPVVVQRVMAGDRLPMTRAERAEVVAQMRAKGASYGDIERVCGLKVERYLPGKVA